MQHLDPIEFKTAFEQTENAVILDVRSEMEYSEGQIPNHILLDFNGGEFEAEFADLDKSKHYFVYCRSGNRSGMACALMNQAGFTSTNLKGGIKAWVEVFGK